MLFHLCEGRGFAFDVELLALAQLLDLRVVEVPIHWVDVSGTSVRTVRDPILMVRDVLRTRQRCHHLEKQLGRRVQESVQPAALDLDAQLHELLHAVRLTGAHERELNEVELVIAEEPAETLRRHTNGRRMAPTGLT